MSSLAFLLAAYREMGWSTLSWMEKGMALFMPYTELLLAYTRWPILLWRQHSRILVKPTMLLST